MLEINQLMFHPCSMDIIELKVISIIQSKHSTQYVLKATKNVGACGRVEVTIQKYFDKWIFTGLVDEDLEYASGLQDFIEGFYYDNRNEARLEYYNNQLLLARSNLERKKELYEDSKYNYEKIRKLITDIKELIKKEQ